MKQLGVVLIVVALVSGCAPKTLSPTGQRVFTANEISIRVGEFQSATIAASDAKQIPQETAREIVKWCIAAQETLRSTPSGWEATLKTGWSALRPKVRALPQLSGWSTAVDIILGVN